MFNFYVVLAGHDKVTDAGRATTRRCRFKALSLQTKSTKIEGLPKTWVITGNSLKISDEKKRTEKFFSTFQKSPVGHEDPKVINWISPL